MAPSLHAAARLSKLVPTTLLLVILTALIAPVSANAAVPACNFPNCAYVTDGVGREVLAATQGSGLALVWQAPRNTEPQDLTVGPDKKLYVALTSTNQIAVLDVSGSTVGQTLKSLASGTSPQGLRFGWTGDLYFNSSTGLRKLVAPGLSTSQDVATGLSFTSPGGIAFLSDGSVLFAGDASIYLVPAVKGVPTKPSTWPSAPFLTATENITGLAVDSEDNVYFAHGNVVDRWVKKSGLVQTWADFTASGDIPAHIEVVPDMVQGASCNTINDLLWVSTYQLSSGTKANGKVWRVQTTSCALDALAAAPTLIASINTKVNGKLAPAIGSGVGPSYRTLKKQFSVSSNVHNFNFGPFSHELANDLNNFTTGPCDASVTATQRSPQDILAKFGTTIKASPIAFYGEQGWITTFVLDYPTCFTSLNGEQYSDHYLAALYTPVNPKVVNIHADSRAPEYTMATGYFPSGPPADPNALPVPGDPGIGNRGSKELVLVNGNFDNTYTFSGFLSPLRDPGDATNNIFNAGQNITFKFQLYTSNGKLLSDTLAQSLANSTVFALAQLTPTLARTGQPQASGQSIKEIPRFKYDAKAHQFLYTLDSGALNVPAGTSATFEATVICDTAGAGFMPHSLTFKVQN